MRTKRMLTIVTAMRNRLLNANDNATAQQVSQAMILLQQDLISELEKELVAARLEKRYSNKGKVA